MLKWTTKLPAEEGWYLYRIRRWGVERAYFIMKAPNGRLYMGSQKGSRGSLVKFQEHVEWAGPLPEPEEPEE